MATKNVFKKKIEKAVGVKEFDLTKATYLVVSCWVQASLVLSQAKITNESFKVNSTSLSSVTSSFYIKSFMFLLNLHHLQALNNFTVT